MAHLAIVKIFGSGFATGEAFEAALRSLVSKPGLEVVKIAVREKKARPNKREETIKRLQEEIAELQAALNAVRSEAVQIELKKVMFKKSEKLQKLQQPKAQASKKATRK